MYSKTTIVGRAGRDPEMRYTQDGKPFTNVNIAVDQGYGERKKTLWFRVTIFGKGAELVAEYVTKGQLVLFEGEIQEPRVWTGQDGQARCNLELVAREWKMLSRSNRDEAGAPAAASSPKPQGQSWTPPEDDEVPF